MKQIMLILMSSFIIVSCDCSVGRNEIHASEAHLYKDTTITWDLKTKDGILNKVNVTVGKKYSKDLYNYLVAEFYRVNKQDVETKAFRDKIHAGVLARNIVCTISVK